MATGGVPRRDGPVALSALFDDALRQLLPPRSRPGTARLRRKLLRRPATAFFSGNRHEACRVRCSRSAPDAAGAQCLAGVPPAAQRRRRDGLPDLRPASPYLASMPCAAQASHETVARALTLLRLTRWLSLVRRRRDPKTGRILGNLYVLHDEPLTPFEAMQLDPDYLGLVSQALTHAAKAVQIVGMNTLREIAEDPMLNGRTLPTRLQVLAQRMARHGWAEELSTRGRGSRFRRSQDGLLRNLEARLRNPKQGRSPRQTAHFGIEGGPYCTYGSYKSSTYSTAREGAAAPAPARAPAALEGRAAKRRDGGLAAGGRVLRQAVLDEWDTRCRNSAVRNPAGYLFGIIQKAIRGEFQGLGRRKRLAIDAACAFTAATSSRPAPSAPPPPAPNGPGREAARTTWRNCVRRSAIPEQLSPG